MNRMKIRIGASLLAACAMSPPAQAALVDATPPALATAASTDPVAAWLQAGAGENGRAFVLAAGPQPMSAEPLATATAVGSSTLPTAASLSLWTFITTMRAQQQGDRFVALETSVSLLRLGEGPVAPVPLPGALWLLVMGLLGMAGVRFTGPAKAGTTSAASASPRPSLGLAPA